MKLASYLGCALSAVLVAGVTSCGVPGIPKPPSLQLPQPVRDLRAFRKGDSVYLAWSTPTKTTDLVTIRHPGITRVCRSTHPLTAECDVLVGEVQPLPPTSSAAAKTAKSSKAPAALQVTYKDSVPASLLSSDPAAQFFYAVLALNQNGRSAGPSNVVSVPAIVAPAPPADFQAQATADGVLLSWTGNPQGQKTPHLHYLYRLYRHEPGTQADAVVAELPFGTLRTYLVFDHTFQWEKTYLYRATVVSLIHFEGKPETRFESADTPSIKVFAHDVFPPAVPSNLQAVFSGVGQKLFIDLTWAPDTDADLAAYNVYRREEGGQSRKINAAPVKAPAFRDSDVSSGHTYFYSVTAVDARGNESEHSSEESEKVP